jgi:hypothetical protein
MLRALALLALLAAPAVAGAKPGKDKPAAAAKPAASPAPVAGQGWTPVLRQKQKQCRAQKRCNLDPRVPDCDACRGK